MSVRRLVPVVPVMTPEREPALIAAAEYSEFCHIHQDCCGRTLCDGDFHVQPECRAWVDPRGGRCSECGLLWCPEAPPCVPASRPARAGGRSLVDLLDQAIATLRMVAAEDTSVTHEGLTVEFGPAQVVLIAFVDANGHAAAARYAFRRDVEREHLGSLSQMAQVAASPVSIYSSMTEAVVRMNLRRDEFLAEESRKSAEWSAEHQWHCEWCSRRFTTERGANAHERTCLGEKEGRNGHRLVSATRYASTTPTVIYGDTVTTVDNSRVGFTCSCGHRGLFDALSVGRVAIKRAFVRHATEAGPVAP